MPTSVRICRLPYWVPVASPIDAVISRHRMLGTPVDTYHGPLTPRMYLYLSNNHRNSHLAHSPIAVPTASISIFRNGSRSLSPPRRSMVSEPFSDGHRGAAHDSITLSRNQQIAPQEAAQKESVVTCAATELEIGVTSSSIFCYSLRGAVTKVMINTAQ